jgi:hypothetical protein
MREIERETHLKYLNCQYAQLWRRASAIAEESDALAYLRGERRRMRRMNRRIGKRQAPEQTYLVEH